MKDLYKENQIYFRFREDIGQIKEIKSNFSENKGSANFTSTYVIVPYTYNGEGIPKSIEITECPQIEELSNLVYVQLEWPRLPGADGYRIYGRESDYLGYLMSVEQPSESNISVYFTDDGSTVPQISKPPKDDSDEDVSGRTRWDSLFFVPGRNVQSAELNDIQLISNNYLKNLGDTIFDEGNIIEGCELDLDSSYENSEFTRYNIKTGKIYILGKVRQVPAGIIDIPKYGGSTIGLIATEKILTPDEDSALKDPSYLEPNYGKDGAVARYYEFSWVLDNVDMVRIYEMLDGILVRTINVISGSPQYGKISKILAKRTFEESGNYVARPFMLKVETGSEDNLFGVRSDTGAIAYLLGNRVEFTNKYLIEFRKGRDTININGEIKTYRTGNSLYETNSKFIKQVVDNVAQVAKIEGITKGLENGADRLDEKTPIKINDLYWTPSGSATIHYDENIDFRLDGDFVDWNVPGASKPEPNTGQTYQIDYIYSRTLVPGVRAKTLISDEIITRPASGYNDPMLHGDIIEVSCVSTVISGGGTVFQEGVHYEVDNGQKDALIQLGQICWVSGAPDIPAFGADYYVSYYYWDHTTEGDYVAAQSYDSYSDISIYEGKKLRDYVDYRTSSIYKPTINTVFIYDYDYYVGRIDRLVLSENTYFFDIKEGSPAEDPTPPTKPSTGMSIARIIIPPYTYSVNDVKIIEEAVPTYTMEKISHMDKRLSNMEYFILLDRLEQNALSYELDYLKKGIFTDAFVGFSKIDFGYKQNIEDLRAFVGLNRTEQYACLPFDVIDIQNTVSPINSAATTARDGKDSYTLKYINQLIIAQPIATNSITVQPFEVLNKFGTLHLLPNTDTWIDTSIKPELKVNFDGVDQVFENYDTLADAISTTYDSWRILDAGVEPGEKEVIEEMKGGEAQDKIFQSGLEDPQLNLPVDAIRTVTEVKATVDKVSSTQNLGDRVIDLSVIKTVRPIPVLFYAEGLVPGIVHNIYFDGQMVNVYPISSTVGIDIINPLPDDDSYTSYLNKFENLKLEITSDYSSSITFSTDKYGVVPNNYGKIAGFYMTPANQFNTGLHRIQIKSAFGGLHSSEAETSFLTQGYLQAKQDVSVTMTLPKLDTEITKKAINYAAPPKKVPVVEDFPEIPVPAKCVNWVNSVTEVQGLIDNHIKPWYERTREKIINSKNSMVEERWLFGYSLTERPDRWRIFFPDPQDISLTLNEVEDFMEDDIDCIGGILTSAGPISAAEYTFWLSSTYIQSIREKMCISWDVAYETLFGCYQILNNIKLLDQIATTTQYDTDCYKQRTFCQLPSLSGKNNVIDYQLKPWYYNNYTRVNNTDLSNFTNDIEKFLFSNDISIEPNAWMILFPDPSNISTLLTLLSGKYKNEATCMGGIDVTGGWINRRYYEWVLSSLRLTSDIDYNRIFNCWMETNNYRFFEPQNSQENFENICWEYSLDAPASPAKIDLTCGPTPAISPPVHCELELTKFNLVNGRHCVSPPLIPGTKNPLKTATEEKVTINSEEELLKHIDDWVYDMYSSSIMIHLEHSRLCYVGDLDEIDNECMDGPMPPFYPWSHYWQNYWHDWVRKYPKAFAALRLANFPDPDNSNSEKIWTGRLAKHSKLTSSAFYQRFIMNSDTRTLNRYYLELRNSFFAAQEGWPTLICTVLASLKERYNQLLECWMKLKNITLDDFTRLPAVNLRRDPLAQSFFTPDITEGKFISAIGLYFENRGDDPIKVILRKMSSGYPTGTVLAEKSLQANQVSVSTDASIETLFEFDDPVWIEPGAEISFVIYSSDPRYKVFYCKLGETDVNTGNVVLKQADIGTMFMAPNLSSWEMRGYSDITFNIYKAKFEPIDAEIIFDNTDNILYSIFSFDTSVFVPVGAGIKSYYSYDAGLTWSRMSINENIDFQTFTGSQLRIKLELMGNNEISPIISKHKTSSKIIKYQPKGRYIARTMETFEEFENIRVIFKASTPDVTTIKVFYSVDDTITWEEITQFEKKYVDLNYWEYEFIKPTISPIDSFKFRIEMETSNIAISPKVKDLRVLLY